MDPKETVGNTGIRLDPQLSTYFKECYFTWIPKSRKFDLQEAKRLKNKLNERYKFDKTSAEESKDEFRLDPVKFICLNLSKAFVHLIVEDWDEATILLAEVKGQIETAFGIYSRCGFQQGFQYLRQGLTAFQLSLMTNGEAWNVSRIYYDDLPEEAHLAVKAAKAYFSHDLKLDLDFRVGLFKELCELDPTQITWKLMILWVMRLQRKKRTHHYLRTPPTSEEWNILVKCLEMETDSMRVRITVLEFLGNIIKSRGWNPKDGTLRFTDNLAFRNRWDVRDYLNDLIGRKNVFAKIENCLRIEQVISDICSFSGCPYDDELRDMRFNCLKKVLSVMPDSSKANHRLGNYFHGIEKDFSEALNYYHKAFECDPIGNYVALMDELKLRLWNPKMNLEDFAILLEQELKSGDKWNMSELAGLYWLLGICCYALEMDVECMKAWEKAYELMPQSLENFKYLATDIRRYKWGSKRLRKGKLKSFLVSANLTEPSEMLRCVLEFMKPEPEPASVQHGEGIGTAKNALNGDPINWNWRTRE